MNLLRVSGWITLISALELIEEAAETAGIDPDHILKLRPEALSDYIEERHADVYDHLMTQAERNGMTPSEMAIAVRKHDPLTVMERMNDSHNNENAVYSWN